jgi:hypothetical protein
LKIHVLERTANRTTNLNEDSQITKEGQTEGLPNKALELTAILQDRIAYIGPWGGSKPGSPSRDARCAQASQEAQSAHVMTTPVTYFNGEARVPTFAIILIDKTDDEQNFREWPSNIGKATTEPSQDDEKAIKSSTSSDETHSFCVTAHGLMGDVTPPARVGDYIAILSGVKLPFALRRSGASRDNCYELLGSCYIDNLMERGTCQIMEGRACQIMEEFSCKYIPGSEDENMALVTRPSADDPWWDQPSTTYPFHPKREFYPITRVLGERRIMLV